MTLAMGLFLMGLTGLGVGFMQDLNVKHVKDVPLIARLRGNQYDLESWKRESRRVGVVTKGLGLAFLALSLLVAVGSLL
jgi:hypothetical protein